MRHEQVTCDGCGRDLTSTSNCVDYRLALTVEGVPSSGRIATLMHIEPPLNRDYHFFRVDCLKTWMTKGGQP